MQFVNAGRGGLDGPGELGRNHQGNKDNEPAAHEFQSIG